MRSRLTLIALSALVTLPVAAGAAVPCLDRTPAVITAPPLASAKCQEAIAKAGGKFMKAKVKTLAKCKLKNPAGTCPLPEEKAKIELAATKSAPVHQQGVPGRRRPGRPYLVYGDLTDDALISSCTLSQLNVVAELVSWEAHGATTEPWTMFAPDSDDAKIARELREDDLEGRHAVPRQGAQERDQMPCGPDQARNGHRPRPDLRRCHLRWQLHPADRSQGQPQPVEAPHQDRRLITSKCGTASAT